MKPLRLGFLLSVLVLFLCYFFSYSLMSRIRVGSLNVNGARDIQKSALIFELLNQKHADIMLFQEIHTEGASETDWRKQWWWWGGLIVVI